MSDHPDFLRSPANLFNADPRSTGYAVLDERGWRERTIDDHYNAVAQRDSRSARFSVGYARWPAGQSSGAGVPIPYASVRLVTQLAGRVGTQIWPSAII
jgi:hypothetical protein